MPGRGRARGRGRGGFRGRGGHGRFVGHMQPNNAAQDEWGIEKQAMDETLDIEKDVQKFFTGTASVDQHHNAQENNKTRYVAGMAVLERNGVTPSQNARVRALAAAWARKDHDLAGTFLTHKENFGLVEVLKALTLLDSSRQIRVHEKKLKRLQLQGKVKPTVAGKVKSNIDNLNAIKPKIGSASGAVCKHIKRWVQTMTKDDLEFFALHYPTEPWKRLADIVHFNPQKDFSQLPWFLPFCYGAPAPDNTMVRNCKAMTAENVNDLLKEYPVPYSHIKQLKDNLTPESKARVAEYTPEMDTLLWYYEDLQDEEVDKVIKKRFEAGVEVTLTYGKLMERLLKLKMIREGMEDRRFYWQPQKPRIENPTKAPFLIDLIPIAERRLKDISLPLEPPIVVIGDRSGSMEVAIRTSTIISSLLTAITASKLVFFNTENLDAAFNPKTIEEVLEMAVTTTATGGTAPAVSLFPFYERKEKVNTFIVVTDEEENQSYKGYKFAPLYKKYAEEVHAAKLVFVSFLRTQHSQGQMVTQLENLGFSPMQFKFDQQRPDLTKLDNLFGLLSTQSANFEEQLKMMETQISTEGIKTVFDRLTVKDNVKVA